MLPVLVAYIITIYKLTTITERFKNLEKQKTAPLIRFREFKLNRAS